MSTKDRYVTFKNIDCYNDAKFVLDAMYELFALKPESKNDFFKRFETKLPDDYTTTPVDELGHDTLYQVCSNVFYIEELFETYEFEKGLNFLKNAEFNCC